MDAAYGGYFGLIAEALDEPARRAYAAIEQADSIVIDPHKHGLQPYGCGCVLFRDPAVGRFYKHDSPYTYFTSKELASWRDQPGVFARGRGGGGAVGDAAAAAAEPGGEFARGLAKGRRAALELDRRAARGRAVRCVGRVLPGPQCEGPGAPAASLPELDIVVWALRAATFGRPRSGRRECSTHAPVRGLHLALVQLPGSWFGLARAVGQNERRAR